MDPDFIDKCRQELTETHGCHTVILYGSHARGDATSASDVDMVGFHDSIEAGFRHARLFNGRYLDFFVFPKSTYEAPKESHLYMRGGKVLCQRDNIGTIFLNQLENIYQVPPMPLTQDEKNARRIWAQKMVDRGERDDLEGRFRVAYLKTALLEDYFTLRDQRYLGSKESFSCIRENAPEAYLKFERVFDPDSSLEDLRELVTLVTRE